METEECTYFDEHQVLYRNVESLCHTPEANITVSINWNLNENVNKQTNKLLANTTLDNEQPKCFPYHQKQDKNDHSHNF